MGIIHTTLIALQRLLNKIYFFSFFYFSQEFVVQNSRHDTDLNALLSLLFQIVMIQSCVYIIRVFFYTQIPFVQVLRARQLLFFLFYFGEGDERSPFSGSTTKRKSNRFNSPLKRSLVISNVPIRGCPHTQSAQAITICIYIYIFIL